uniref:Serine protease n=1 Tax=Sinocyclocheilus anshuiensis TaxID=1608454 RepID=A0A671Q5F0_9TELE
MELKKKKKSIAFSFNCNKTSLVTANYCFNRLKRFSVSCKTSMTVLEALNTSQMFKNEKDKKKNKQKEILIQRCKEGVPTAAVKTDFPCCLIETDEILYIDFIQKDENSCTNRTTADPSLRKTSMPETLVTFQVKKEGGQKVRLLLKSKALRRRVQYVCVYAFKGEKIKTALKRDGRFKNDIFRKHCALSDELKHEWSNPVDNLDRKAFQLVVLSDKNQPDSQDDLTPQEKKHDGNTKSTNPSIKRYAQLKQREKLKNKSDVQKFFRAEYGKNSSGGSALGTGFLLFDRYILTNAHVIGEPTDVPKVNAGQFTAVFGYEDLDSEDSKRIPVEQLAAHSYGTDDKGRYLDYALLELDDIENIAEYPKLLDCYRPNAPINRGQICIVGHPGEGVKKMDPCFIIERENRIEAANKHKTENQHLIHLMNEACSKEKWNFLANENQITYDSCFFHGSSGSPVFDVDCNLIGIHTGGYKYKTEGDKTRNFMEYGFSMQPILENISVQARMKDLTNIFSVIEQNSENYSFDKDQS